MKDRLKLISTALIVLICLVILTKVLLNSLTLVSKEVVSPHIENTAKCKSVGGEYGINSCYVDGKSVDLGE